MVIVVAVAVIGAFFAVVAPLFATSGAAVADLSGAVPANAVAGRPLEIDAGFDNTGNSVISPVCVEIGVTGPLRPSSVTFQGVDVETVKNGEACGGSLNGQETISLRMVLVPSTQGTATVTLNPAQGRTQIGNGFSGTIAIAPT